MFTVCMAVYPVEFFADIVSLAFRPSKLPSTRTAVVPLATAARAALASLESASEQQGISCLRNIANAGFALPRC
jgi:hypothetical protein